jgi:hypothetical protein
MSNKSEKTACPPTISFKSMTGLFNQLREHGHVPTRIDKTLMPKASGSQQSATIAALRYLGLIDETGKPVGETFSNLVLANDDDRKDLIAQILKSSYGFIFDDKSFAIDKASSGEMVEKFRNQNLTGSTVTKTIQFFLAAAKDANIKVSPHIKAPPAPKPSGIPRKTGKSKVEADNSDENEEPPEDETDTERFEIPIPGKSSVQVIVPSDLDADDWEMLQSMINVYIKRWKNFKTEPKNE